LASIEVIAKQVRRSLIPPEAAAARLHLRFARSFDDGEEVTKRHEIAQHAPSCSGDMHDLYRSSGFTIMPLMASRV
jgi:hypothetical protein